MNSSKRDQITKKQSRNVGPYKHQGESNSNFYRKTRFSILPAVGKNWNLILGILFHLPCLPAGKFSLGKMK